MLSCVTCLMMCTVHSFVTKMAHHIRVKAQDDEQSSTSSPGRSTTAASVDADDDDDEETLLAELCPHFIWSVRDFTLQLDLDGKQATPDEYLERCLQEKPGKTPQHHIYYYHYYETVLGLSLLNVFQVFQYVSLSDCRQ